MHEMGIADAIITAARSEAGRHPGARVLRVGLRLGELAGVDRESLTFCFDVLIKGTDLDKAALAIEATPCDELEIAWLELEEPNGNARPAREESPR
jgi:hydrogenase nickel incorporation protein HypA/HybF